MKLLIIIAGPQISGAGDGLQIWRVAANILKKQLRTAGKGWSSSLGLLLKSLNFRFMCVLRFLSFRTTFCFINPGDFSPTPQLLRISEGLLYLFFVNSANLMSS
jgi:hypothetical protein